MVESGVGLIAALTSSPHWLHRRIGFIAALGSSLRWLHQPVGFIAALASSPRWLHRRVGFIALFGVAFLNGVGIMAVINRPREEGRAVKDAALEGAAMRLRPVLPTLYHWFEREDKPKGQTCVPAPLPRRLASYHA